MKRTFILSHQQDRQRAAQCVAEAPDGYVVDVREPTRNSEQNAKLHALISDIAERCEWAGRRWDAETWKRLLVAAWDRAVGEPVVLVSALDGRGVDVVFRRTSKLSKRECSDLIEFINAWAAEQPAMERVES